MADSASSLMKESVSDSSSNPQIAVESPVHSAVELDNLCQFNFSYQLLVDTITQMALLVGTYLSLLFTLISLT